MTTIHVRAAWAGDQSALARIFRDASLSNAGDRAALRVRHDEAD